MHSRTVLGRPVRRSKRKIDQPILCPSHCKLLVILSILQSQAADNQLVFVHHQAFHNYFVFFIISESVSTRNIQAVISPQ